ncbi:MAG TPA: GNAT family N-acetyltransferase [Phycisphaerae bacterium]|nr:GNAT family N-acetyltransferase [Phycisphaerae bacterium]
MDTETLELIDPCPELEADFRAMGEEYLAAGNPHERSRYAEALQDFPAYLRKLQDQAAGTNVPEGYVPGNHYWLVREGETIVAVSSLRHRLTDSLKIEGGHIGYGVRPSQRLRGYGKLICAMTLDKARQLGLKRVLITCDTDNTASAKIIRASGGVLDGESISPRSGKMVSRYWIEL